MRRIPAPSRRPARLRPAGFLAASLLVANLLVAAAPVRAVAAGTPPDGHGGPVRALALSADGVTLLSAGFDERVLLWTVATPAAGAAPGPASAARPRLALRWHRGAVAALVALPEEASREGASPGGARADGLPPGGFASAGEDGRIAVWPRDPGPEPLHVLEGHEGPVTALAAHGAAILSASRDGTARLWSLRDPRAAPRVLEGHPGGANAAAFRADGTPATAGYDGMVRLWRDGAAGMAAEAIAEFGLPVNALVALPDGTLAAGVADGTLRLVAPDGAVRGIAVGTRPVAALAASPDGRTLAVASLGGDVTLVSVADLRATGRLEGPGLPVWSVALGADGRAWTGGMDHVVRAWDAATGRHLLDLGAPAAAAPAGPDPHGARVFRACGACHALSPDAGPMAGPTLHGLFGRRMGTVPGYAYSDRLARGDITWTRETVADLFTRGPAIVTPGTRMPEQRVDDPDDMAALLRFLEATTR